MQIEIIRQADCPTTNWAGGSTTQLYILPAGLGVEDDFIFRISSATVNSGKFSFSDFSAYNRFLTVLKGNMFIRHGEAPEQCLCEFAPVFFDGAVQTDSRSTTAIIDFNIIWKKNLKTIEIASVDCEKLLKVRGTAFFYSFAEDSKVLLNGQAYNLESCQLLKVAAEEFEMFIRGKGIYCVLPEPY